MNVDIGVRFAYKGSDAQRGKSTEGEQDGQEKDPEEVEEDPTDEAVVSPSPSAIRASFIVMSAILNSARYGKSDLICKRGRYRDGCGPFFVLPFWFRESPPRLSPPTKSACSWCCFLARVEILNIR
jgi:hypothetical protein